MTELKTRIEEVAKDIEQNVESFPWQVGQLLRALPQLRNAMVRHGAGHLIRSYKNDYIKVQKEQFPRPPFQNTASPRCEQFSSNARRTEEISSSSYSSEGGTMQTEKTAATLRGYGQFSRILRHLFSKCRPAHLQTRSSSAEKLANIAGGGTLERGSEPTNVELPIDAKIPFDAKALPAYISFVGLWISGINFLKKEFGERASADIGKFVTDLASLYPEAGTIFRSAQTTFTRTGKGGWGTKLLRAWDDDKNAAPSLHVEVVAHTWSRLTDIIDRQTDDPARYERIKEVYFQKTVGILESVLLVKQHVVVDVALGLTMICARDAAFTPLETKDSSKPDKKGNEGQFLTGFTKERAYKMIDAMFEKDAHSMPPETVAEARETIRSIYDDVMSKIKNGNKENYVQTVIDYIRRLPS